MSYGVRVVYSRSFGMKIGSIRSPKTIDIVNILAANLTDTRNGWKTLISIQIAASFLFLTLFSSRESFCKKNMALFLEILFSNACCLKQFCDILGIYKLLINLAEVARCTR